MENHNPPERSVPIQYVRSSRAFRQFKNPPQPHMCIQDTIKDTSEKLFINVLGWQKIANPKHYSDPIPLYGGMQVPQNCGPNSNRPPMLVFAVMVNPDILKANGKNAANLTDREALVSLLCDFVEAMNPGLLLGRDPVILKDRDLAGELKDVWLAVQNKREREKGMTQDVMYKVYDIDGIGGEENEEDRNGLRDAKHNDGDSPTKKQVKSSKQILMNAGQKSEFDSANETTKPSSSFRKDWNPVHGKTTEGWDEFSKRNISTIKSEGDMKKQRLKSDKSKVSNGKAHYDFFPVFDNKTAENEESDDTASAERIKQDKNEDNSKIILDPMQKLVLHSTDNKICDNKTSALSSLSS
ncbi:uncharacterized protein LOC126366696 isoform X2 [Pectinophora gossypiella]|uniref:uncharacterized protein LOC126366696 isoform X2 n=1 Tax=Pectinophora gossypiella TaxID=13191 RepID=UPI00214E6729|nr:uncharacterized protein LOC126366696 isoform X2 [Pectinophora gossypiella]